MRKSGAVATPETDEAPEDSAEVKDEAVTETARPRETAAADAGSGVQPETEADAAPEPVAELKAAAEAAPEVAPPLPRPDVEDRENADLILDFDQLSAGGFLIPWESAHRQSEEYQQIKRRLLGNMVEGMLDNPRPKNLIMLTSAMPGEGKTFTSFNLAISIAMEMDRTVLAVDADIIKSDLTKAFGARGRPGLFDILSDDRISLSGCLLRTNVPSLSVLPAGFNEEKVTEKLASENMRALVAELAERYSDRVIIFDCPPLLASSGATALAPLVGQVVLVVEARKTPRSNIKEALGNLDSVPITGVVLNKMKEYGEGSPYYYYKYGYYRQDKP
ncbi:MAG: AAA family ATPase [Gammaproteobacteria bacterium]|nr:AAA family ATPase [Gammaproteobacteria bacterium]